MKRRTNICLSGLLAALVVSAFILLPAQANAQITENEVRTMDQFLDAHSQVRADLTRSPQLGNDRNYLNSHADLNDFLNHNQDIRNEMRNNANNFMRAVEDFQSHGRHWGGPVGYQNDRPGNQYQPHMRNALEHLQQALRELEQADNDKGGYRKKAIEEVQRAEQNVQAGINYDNHH